MIERRGKQKEKHFAHIKSLDFYKHYTSKNLVYYVGERKYINRKTKYYVDLQKYNLILATFNQMLRDEIIMNAFEFSMPARLGTLKIGKVKSEPYLDKEGNFVNQLPVDWKSTLELWSEDSSAKESKKLIRHQNQHFDGYVARWRYNVFQATYKNKKAYKFIPCRTAKLKLAEALKSGERKVDYYLI